MRTFATLLVLLAALAVAAPAAGCSCASSLYVGGVQYLGYGGPNFDAEPAQGTVDVVVPACCEGHDARGEARRVAGLPAAVAVTDRGTLYIAQGQLLQLAGHPLHVDDYGRRGACRPGAGQRATAKSRRGLPADLPFGIDGRTRLVNRTVTTPLRAGQEVRATTSRCRNGLWADDLRFVGATPAAPAPPAFDFGGTGPGGVSWLVLALVAFVVLLAAAFIYVLVRIGRALRRVA